MIYLHIGVHKTGSSSIQRYLGQNIDFLKHQGFDFFRGMHRNPNNHTELHMASLRYDRDSFGRYGYDDITFDENYTAKVRGRIQALLQSSIYANQIFTNEGLSWLRFEDEIERLKSLFSGYEDRLRIILYLRNPEDFQRSYKNQIQHKLQRPFSTDKSSVLYVEPESWVFKHEQVLALFSKAFAPEKITILDYDKEMQRSQNIIPSFLDAIGCPQNTESDLNDFFVNQSVRSIT